MGPAVVNPTTVELPDWDPQRAFTWDKAVYCRQIADDQVADFGHDTLAPEPVDLQYSRHIASSADAARVQQQEQQYVGRA